MLFTLRCFLPLYLYCARWATGGHPLRLPAVSEIYDSYLVRIPKGQKATVQAAADAAGESQPVHKQGHTGPYGVYSMAG